MAMIKNMMLRAVLINIFSHYLENIKKEWIDHSFLLNLNEIYSYDFLVAPPSQVLGRKSSATSVLHSQGLIAPVLALSAARSH